MSLLHRTTTARLASGPFMATVLQLFDAELQEFLVPAMQTGYEAETRAQEPARAANEAALAAAHDKLRKARRRLGKAKNKQKNAPNIAKLDAARRVKEAEKAKLMHVDLVKKCRCCSSFGLRTYPNLLARPRSGFL